MSLVVMFRVTIMMMPQVITAITTNQTMNQPYQQLRSRLKPDHKNTYYLTIKTIAT
jgi:hypothetical protein